MVFSVAEFGEISPLFEKEKNKSLTILRGFMLNLQNFKSFLQLFVIFGKISLLLTEKY